jgi:F0F1-type ATP synthase membrane subunit b/b'
VPGVKEAVEQLVAAERAEAEQRAEQLRAQLAEVEAHLAELREVR